MIVSIIIIIIIIPCCDSRPMKVKVYQPTTELGDHVTEDGECVCSIDNTEIAYCQHDVADFMN